MSGDDRFQDFVDGRMHDAEREAFQARIAADPELARRWAEHRERVAALREDAPLPPGFHTRTRAAFERGRARRRRALFGVIPWEAAGLAAAAGLALALFVPALLRDEIPLATPQRAESRATLEADSVAGESQGLTAPATPLRDAAESEELRSGLKAKADPADEGARPNELQKKSAPAPRPVAAEPAPERMRSTEATGSTASDDLADRPESFAPAPPASPEPKDAPAARPPAPSAATSAPPPVPAPPAERRADAVLGRAEVQGNRPQAQKAAAEAEADARREFGVGVRALAIPHDAVERYSVTSVTDPETLRRLTGRVDLEWGGPGRPKEPVGGKNSLKEESDRGGLGDLEAPRLGERAVVIGARDRPFSCVGLRVATTPAEHVIYLAPAAQEPTAEPTACAVLLPDDGRRIVVVDP